MAAPILPVIDMGQSNMSGMGGDDSLSLDVGTTVAFEYDPSGDSISTLNDPLIDSSGGQGTLIPAFAYQLQRETSLMSCHVQEAESGAAMHIDADANGNYWDPDEPGNLTDPAVSNYNSMVTYLSNNGYDPMGGLVLMSQGERDGRAIKDGNLTKSQYKSALEDCIAAVRSGVSEPEMTWGIVRTATEFDKVDEGWPKIREAQQEVVAADENVIMVYDETMQFQDRGWMDTDLLHYNQTGLNQIGLESADSVVSHFRSSGVL